MLHTRIAGVTTKAIFSITITAARAITISVLNTAWGKGRTVHAWTAHRVCFL